MCGLQAASPPEGKACARGLPRARGLAWRSRTCEHQHALFVLSVGLPPLTASSARRDDAKESKACGAWAGGGACSLQTAEGGGAWGALHFKLRQPPWSLRKFNLAHPDRDFFQGILGAEAPAHSERGPCAGRILPVPVQALRPEGPVRPGYVLWTRRQCLPLRPWEEEGFK